MNEPEWIDFDVVLAIHDEQLAEHGGSSGIRDQGLLESALARPRNLFAYSPHATIRELAATYVVGIGKNHGFVDGNKRTGWVVGAVVLELNGVTVTADQSDVVRIMFGIADGSISEKAFVSWLERADVTA
ncbi:MAG: type II toxin-antitoxin system death-on-curing family toxin [Acidobacteriaceae bacterium]|nr:type II toxin-antitoxin system death-on-curing family toxin [Acidobacteriaceae bacterium]